MSNHYRSEAEIEKVVNDFELCRTGKDDFHHSQHLIVAVTYLDFHSLEAVRLMMKEALLRFLNHHGVDPKMYNETLTVFWLEMVARVLKELPTGTSLVEKCNRTLESLNNPKLALEFYSEELLWSELARESFVQPDLKQLD
jgi:hypothetical protein